MKYGKTIGRIPIVFVFLATMTVSFGTKYPDEAESSIREILHFAGFVLFSIGLLVAVLKLVSVAFNKRPARGMLDGLAAGLLAGLVGGAFGYGFHAHYIIPETANGAGYWLYAEPRILRISLCVLFAVPVGGVLGAILDVVHADRDVKWRLYLGPLLLAIGLLLVGVGVGLYTFLPDMHNSLSVSEQIEQRTFSIGIIISDIQLLFEVFVIGFASIVFTSFGWSSRKMLSRIILFIAISILARVPTFILHSPDAVEQAGVPLYKHRFIYSEVSQAQERWGSFFAESSATAAFWIIAFMLWSVAAYYAIYKDWPLVRFSDKMLKVNARIPK